MQYTEEELPNKLLYYKSLPEKARRHFLALEYERLGRGSQRYLSEVFKCSRNTITKGTRELSSHLEGGSDRLYLSAQSGRRSKKKSC